jgi:hypothetical protein
MQRLVCLALVLTAACGGGTPTGEATLSGVSPAVKAAASEPLEAPDAAGTQVLGWNILFYSNDAGGDCLEGTVVAKIAIYTTQAVGSKPQALLQTGGISIVTEAPPTVNGQATANMGVEGVSMVQGQLQIEEFHLTPDAMHADRIRGTVNAGGYDANQQGVSLTGSFTAPICQED